MPSSVRDRRRLCPPAPGQRPLVLIQIALLLLLTLPAAAGAQVLYGSLVGNVSDDTGAARERRRTGPVAANGKKAVLHCQETPAAAWMIPHTLSQRWLCPPTSS